MKRCFAFLVLIAAAFPSFTQGIDFFHGTWEETLAEARKRGVVIFVDAYTTWCGPCKRMSAQIFPLQEVGDYYNPNFVNVKIDMESEAGLKFKRKYPVRSYPTFFFIAPDEAIVMQVVGAKPADQFIALGKEALKKYDGSAQYQVKYDAGDHSYEVVYNLIVALNKSGKSSLKIANEYLKTQTDLRTPDNLKLILEAFIQVDSKMYEYFGTYHKDLVKTSGTDIVNERIRNAASKTVARAVEYESEALLLEGNAAMQKYLPAEADLFNITSSMDYAQATGNAELYLKNARLYLKKTSGDDASRLHGMANTIIKKFPEHTELLQLGEKAAKMSVQLKDIPNHIITYATLIYLQGDKTRAVSVIDEAIVRLQKKEQKVDKLTALKSKLGAS
jgi:thiol-disulfide isomerase/thioredoxin